MTMKDILLYVWQLPQNLLGLLLLAIVRPEDIYDYFGVSKKTFKRAVGALYKEHIITITADGVRLL